NLSARVSVYIRRGGACDFFVVHDPVEEASARRPEPVVFHTGNPAQEKGLPGTCRRDIKQALGFPHPAVLLKFFQQLKERCRLSRSAVRSHGNEIPA
ncbi:MAG: hypothetical protein H6Q50_232, partial [Deltaproteobacteria bacterium]|nr:hypothetical protein [Deltaproteobacteria bacterium]